MICAQPLPSSETVELGGSRLPSVHRYGLGAVLSVAFAAFAWALLGWGLDLEADMVDPSWLLPVVVVGYLRATGLECPTRLRIYNHLVVLPGDHFRSIARTLGLGVGETRRHLDILIRNRIVREDKSTGKCRYYLCGGRADPERNELFAKYWRCRDLRGRVLLALRYAGQARPSAVAEELGISRQLASYHLAYLAAHGLAEKDGPCYRA